jgi:hypothetical protein
VSARRALAWGIAAVVAYATAAALSAELSPRARRPLLDGLGPAAPYRWSAPPPELADANEEPLPARAELRLFDDGSEATVVFSGDDQITIVLPGGAFPQHGDDRSVVIEATPLDPAPLGEPPQPLAFFGNAVRIDATYQPSGDPARLAEPLQVILSYPVTPTLHANPHQLASSPDGETWRVLESTEAVQQQQAEADVDRLGFVAVVGEPTAPPVTVSPAPDEGSGSTPVAWILGGVAAVAFVAGVLLIVRGSRGRG